MLSLFQRKRPPVAGTPSPALVTDLQKGLMQPESAASLLATPRRQKLLEHIWQRTSLSRKQFVSLHLAPLERYAALVQLLPASEAHHHAYPGGMLDHGLEIVAFALKLRQSHLLPAGATPEDQAAQSEAWTAATAYAALLHDIGKIAVDLHVEYADGSVWHPWHGPLQQPYRFRYRQDREYRLHGAATGLLYIQVLDRNILDWLSQYPDLWRPLLYVLAGQYEHAGVLGELITKADQASVSESLGGDPSKALAAPKHALQRKLLAGLRYLLHEELKLNQAGPADGWLTDDALWLVSKTVSDKLRAHLLSQGIDGIPDSNTAVFDVLQDHGIAQPTPDGKAIWRATVTSDTGWSHSFTLLRLAPASIWKADERPGPFAGIVMPQSGDASAAEESLPTTPVTDPLPSTGDKDYLATPQPHDPPIQPADGVDAMLSLLENVSGAVGADALHEPIASDQKAKQDIFDLPAEAKNADTLAAEQAPPLSGEHFIVWLRNRLQTHKLVINDARALVHTVADTAYLVSPGIFQRYAQEHPQVAVLAKQADLPEWRWVQKCFEKLQVHRKQPNGLNIWTCEVSGPRKTRRLHGYLLDQANEIFTEVPPNNPYLSLTEPGPQQVGNH
ncbi:MobH family relaxase [Alcaligenes nematophilus]|uniref:MobH family relaxase n=1 Tax=Alcaligenes nematophilus TaxID=2994643 RepID=UPI0034E07D6D